MDYAALSAAFDDHGFTYVSSTRKVAWINDIVADICSREPWPFLEASLTLTFDGSSATPTNLPTNLKSVLSVVDPTTGISLMPLRLDEFEKHHQTDSEDIGTAQQYYFDTSRSLKVWQIPAATTTLRMKYLKYHALLTSSSVEADILIPSQHHAVIQDGCLWKLHRMEDSMSTASSFKQDYENRLVQMRAEIWARQYDRPDHIQILDSDFYDG